MLPSTHRILLIDDNADVRGLLKSALEAEGYSVQAAADGSAALDALRRERADVVVTDIYMPGMEGIETIVTLRKDYPNTRIIAISRGGSHLRSAGAGPMQPPQADPLSLARQFGADATLRKPFLPAELIAAVQRVLVGPGSSIPG